MMRLIIRWIINALVLIGISAVLPIYFDNFYAALVAALALGVVNALIKPLVVVLTLPINILTLGLFTLVINAALFWFVSTFIKGFYIADFWTAFWAALIFSIISAIVSWLDHRISNKK